MPAPSVESVDNLWLGILLDPQQATVVHDLGPFGGSAEVSSLLALSVCILDLHKNMFEKLFYYVNRSHSVSNIVKENSVSIS